MSLTTQLFPSLDAATEAALRASIERFGVIVPVVEDQHRNTLDGYQRKRIADELGTPYEIQTCYVADEDEARAIAHTLNADRRHLTLEQRREVVAALRQDGHSLRAIAGAIGEAKSTVHRDIEQLSQVGQLKPPKIIKGLDGKSRKAERKAAAAARAKAKLERELERIDAAEVIVADPPPPVAMYPVSAPALSDEEVEVVSDDDSGVGDAAAGPANHAPGEPWSGQGSAASVSRHGDCGDSATDGVLKAPRLCGKSWCRGPTVTGDSLGSSGRKKLLC